jgi:hypothetical protein
VVHLLNFSQHVANCMDHLPNGTAMLKDLLRMSWRSLILMAVADAPQFFSREFLAELESHSAFRFEYLRNRNKNLAAREALYARFFDAFVEASPADANALPVPSIAAQDASRPQIPIPGLERAMAGQAPESALVLMAP